MLRKRYAARAIEAIRGSIKKWEAIVRGERHCMGWADCPLCILYNDMPTPCRSCPIMHDTGSFCYGTPHKQYKHAWLGSPQKRKAAKKFLAYLRGLLRRVLKNQRKR